MAETQVSATKVQTQVAEAGQNETLEDTQQVPQDLNCQNLSQVQEPIDAQPQEPIQVEDEPGTQSKVRLEMEQKTLEKESHHQHCQNPVQEDCNQMEVEKVDCQDQPQVDQEAQSKKIE